MSKLLFDTHPIVINPELAERVGLNESIVLQQIHYWLEKNRNDGRNFHDGRYWTYNSIKNWHEKNFRFWGFNTVQRAFASLIKKGYLITGSYNQYKFDQTKWYSIDYKALETLDLPNTPKWGNGMPQDETMVCTDLGRPIPETTNTEINNTEISISAELSLEKFTIVDAESKSKSRSKSEEKPKTKPKTKKDADPTTTRAREEIKREEQKPVAETPTTKKVLSHDRPAHKANGQYESTSTEEECIAYEELLQANIQLPILLEKHPEDAGLFREAFGCMMDVFRNKGVWTKINGQWKSWSVVTDQYLKLTPAHIEHVIGKYKEQQHQILHKHSYIKTVLYNAVLELSLSDANDKARAEGPATPRYKPPEKPRSRFVNFPQREYDFDEIERLSEERNMRLAAGEA